MSDDLISRSMVIDLLDREIRTTVKPINGGRYGNFDK